MTDLCSNLPSMSIGTWWYLIFSYCQQVLSEVVVAVGLIVVLELWLSAHQLYGNHLLGLKHLSLFVCWKFPTQPGKDTRMQEVTTLPVYRFTSISQSCFSLVFQDSHFCCFCPCIALGKDQLGSSLAQLSLCPWVTSPAPQRAIHSRGCTVTPHWLHLLDFSPPCEFQMNPLG